MKFLHHHKKTLFPLVLLLLTLALMAFMVIVFSQNQKNSGTIAPQTDLEPVVTDEAYRTEVRQIVTEYEQALPSVETELDRLALTEQTLDKVLMLRVPSGYRNLHLEIATSLYQMVEGLRGQAGALATGEERWQKMISENPWLK